MAQNPLLGSKISLISKKNIRYEGTLYSINEANATVALQNVTSFGTEGREKLDPETAFVAPQEGIHAYLLFRGCDIKDLHVHEPAKPPEPAPATTAAASQPNEPATAKAPPKAPPASDLPPPPQQSPATNTPTTTAPTATAGAAATGVDKSKGKGKENQPGRSGGGGGPKKANNRGGRGGAQVGTGASLLNRKARGTVQSGPGPEGIEGEFDFQAKLEEFEKDPDDDNEDDDEAGDEVAGDSNNNYYDKDDFFDSISCDALDKQQGIDNRLRGKEERNLNTETFGAVALDSQRRRRGRGGGRGGGGGGAGGRSTGGRGRGRGGRGRGRGRGRYNNSENGGTNRSATKGPVQPTASS
ncbi:Scd6-like Sm domain containing protein [Nitzschia inconspicua]|uniref:Scd6-like Sm domain containing protein n=1 Tax=Nitzschia inconspicua TaxID=303405 RepID=A0A9K3M6Y4_9STRA|nr:Scd6-like Sm domain containing protein [Nitzschia inconspicua]